MQRRAEQELERVRRSLKHELVPVRAALPGAHPRAAGERSVRIPVRRPDSVA